MRSWKELYDPKEVEERLLKRNRAHFGQSERTPFATKEMPEKIPIMAKLAEDVLEGKVIEEIRNEAGDILRECNKNVGVSKIDMEEFEVEMRMWREETSTLPYGRYLGMYKCFVRQGERGCDADTYRSVQHCIQERVYPE